MRVAWPAQGGAAVALMGSTVSTAVVGLAFWAVAARTYPAASVGAASAVVSAATLVATAAQLNLTAVFTRFVPVAGAHTVRFVTRGYLVTMGLTVLGSAGFAWSGAADGYLGSSVAQRVAFVLLAVLLLLSVLQDAVLIGLRRSGVVLVENLAFAVTKVAVLVACALIAVPHGVLLAWLVPLVAIVAAISGGLFGFWLPRHARAGAVASGESLPPRRRLLSVVAAEYVKSLLAILAPTVIPLLIVARLGAGENAFFAIPWMINAAVVSLFYNVSAAFVVETAHGAPLSGRALRLLLVLIGGTALAGLLVGAVLPGPLLGLLGPDYAEHGAALFRRLALALPLEAVTSVYYTFVWIERRIWRLVALQTVNAALLLGGTLLLLPRSGIVGVGSAYLAAHVVLGSGSLVAVWRRLRPAGRRPVIAGGDGEPDRPGMGPDTHPDPDADVAREGDRPRGGAQVPLPRAVHVVGVQTVVRVGDAARADQDGDRPAVEGGVAHGPRSPDLLPRRPEHGVPYGPGRQRGSPEAVGAGPAPARRPDPSESAARTRRRVALVPAIAVLASAVGLALWWRALPDVDPSRMDGRGLLVAVPPLWYLALALAGVGASLPLLIRPSGRRDAPVTLATLGGLGALITVLYATTSAVYEVPRQYATYKHVAVVEYVLAGHPLDRSVDIYQNWPGFFLVAAQIHRWTGVPVLTLAQWCEPFFAAVVALAVAWAVSGLWRGADVDRRRSAGAAALVVTCSNWIGQNYFAPQALAFPLALLVIGMMVRMVPTPLGRQLRFVLVGGRLRRAPRLPSTDGAMHRFWGSPAGALVCLAAYAMIVVTHQLTPVIVLGQAMVFAVVFRMRHAWLPVAFVALEAAWLGHAWGYVSRHFAVLQVDGMENLRPPAHGPADSLPWAKELTWASPVMMIVLFVLTLVALVALGRRARSRPTDRWMLPPVLFGLVPVSVVLVQPYGNEGIFRAFLFALPWTAALVGAGVLVRSGRAGVRPTVLVVPALLVGLWLPASFAPELDVYAYPSDVRTAIWAADETPPGAALMRLAGGSPIPLTADYAQRRFDWETFNTPVTEWPEFAKAVDGGAAAVAGYVGQRAAWYPVADVYLVLGPGQAANVRYHGDLGSVSWADLVAAIAAEGSFELVHTDGDSSVWHYLGTTASSAW